MSHDDFAVETVPGLPAALPAGESLLWQGKPQWRSLAIRALHARKVAIYFLILMVWSGSEALMLDQGWSAVHNFAPPLSIVLIKRLGQIA